MYIQITPHCTAQGAFVFTSVPNGVEVIDMSWNDIDGTWDAGWLGLNTVLRELRLGKQACVCVCVSVCMCVCVCE
jgi:hypothetical protein